MRCQSVPVTWPRPPPPRSPTAWAETIRARRRPSTTRDVSLFGRAIRRDGFPSSRMRATTNGPKPVHQDSEMRSCWESRGCCGTANPFGATGSDFLSNPLGKIMFRSTANGAPNCLGKQSQRKRNCGPYLGLRHLTASGRFIHHDSPETYQRPRAASATDNRHRVCAVA